jgi:hypothetical protein
MSEHAFDPASEARHAHLGERVTDWQAKGLTYEQVADECLTCANRAEERGKPGLVADFLDMRAMALARKGFNDEGAEIGKRVSNRLADEKDRREALGDAAVAIVHEFPKIRAGIAVREHRRKASEQDRTL